MIVSDSKAVRTATNNAVDAARRAEKFLEQLAHPNSAAVDIASSVQQIQATVQAAKQYLETGHALSQRAAQVPLNPAFSPLILQAQLEAQTQIKTVAKVLQHAASICWVKMGVKEEGGKGGKGDDSGGGGVLPAIPTSTTSIDTNAAEQKALPFVPPVLKPKINIPVEVKSTTQLANQCEHFCHPTERSRTKLQKSGCIHGCRVASAVLPNHSWPGKWVDRVDCPEYCEKTVAQIMKENQSESEDERAEWVAECHWSCKRN